MLETRAAEARYGPEARRGRCHGGETASARPPSAKLPPPLEPATLSGKALPTEPKALPAEPPSRRRLKKLRFALIFLATALLGAVSFAFGVFMAVASDLPRLEARYRQENARNSVLLDDRGVQIGMLSDRDQVLLTPRQIPPIVREAVIAIEDKRFMTGEGVDLRSIARAGVADVLHGGAVQGASTIEQQFVKNALGEQTHRTIFEKLREAALAFHLAHHWSKAKILTEYLNTIYFGNGAYGVEAAAQTYFGQELNHRGCGLPKHPLCVEELAPWEAALLAGIIQSPTDYDPVTHPAAARARRNVVLRQMLEQGYLNRAEYEESTIQALPAPQDVQPPQQPLVDGVDAGYFDSWVGQQVVARYGAERTYYGGLQVHTTLDLALQRAAEEAVTGYLPGPEGPTAALVAIENATGKVRAMVGGRNYDESPFNLATEGERQPGSSFKAFDLAAALEEGVSPYSVWSSRVKTFRIPHSSEVFTVHNDENAYTGSDTLVGATAYSDNSIYAEVGLDVGTHRIAALARDMGITTPISTNPAMTIGGLKTGVTPLDMAHAYETIAHGGQVVSGTLAEPATPVGIEAVAIGGRMQVDHTTLHRVLPAGVASTETEMLETPLQYGTARAAALGRFAAGKTGTTTNYGDAWFVGWDHRYTVAVWVGFPNGLVPMSTEFNGGPVLGGTFPALIWHSFMVAAARVERERERAEEEGAARTLAARRAGTAGAVAAAAAGGGAGEAGTTGASAHAPATTPREANGAHAPTSTPAPAAGTGHTSAPSAAGGHGEGQPSTEGAEGTRAPAPKTPAASPPAPTAPAPTGAPAAGGAPSQAPASEAPAPKVSGGTGAPSGGASPHG
jgi:penicillin-binding protein 1A